MYQNLNGVNETVATAYSVGCSPLNTKQAQSAGFSCAVTVQAPAANTFTAAVTDIITQTAHGYLTGLVVRFTTTTTLPAGLSLATDYYVVKLDANTYKVAVNLANAIATVPVVVDITTTGTGTHTATPTALAGASVKLQCCLDDVITSSSVWIDVPIEATGDATKSNAITVSANFFLYKRFPASNWFRAYYTLTTGQLSVAQLAMAKGST